MKRIALALHDRRTILTADVAVGRRGTGRLAMVLAFTEECGGFCCRHVNLRNNENMEIFDKRENECYKTKRRR